jgi:hypothetical protein
MKFSLLARALARVLLPHEEYPSMATIIFLLISAKIGFALDILKKTLHGSC